LSEIRAITFDLDGTMLDRRATFEVFARSQIIRFARFFTDVDHDLFFDRVVELDRDGSASKERVFAGPAEEFGLPAEAVTALPADFRDRFPLECVAFPGLDDVLSRLNRAGYRLAVITNGGVRIQQRKIDVMGIEPAFDYIAISEGEGVRKPDPEIFRRTLERLDVSPEEAVHVGDNPGADVAGAKAAGLRAIWHRGPRFDAAPGADAEITSITQVPEVVTRLGAGT
jgi:putative hydrolase of the HAD superfamily